MANAIRKVIPMLDRVLVRRAASEATTKGGVILPEKSQIPMVEGTVIAVGQGARNKQTGEYIPCVFKAGDRVLLPKYGGTKVDLEGVKETKEEYLLFRENDIQAKVE